MPAKRFPLEIVLSATDKVSGPFRRLTGHLRQALAPLRTLTTRLKRLNKALGVQRLMGALSGFGRGLAGVATKARALGTQLGLIAAIGVASVAALVNAYATAGDTIAKTADQMGLGVEAFQELTFAADRAGIEGDALSKGFKAFTKTLGEAKVGTGTLFNILGKMDGALLKQFQGLTDTNEAFSLLMQVLEDAPDTFTRNAIAANVFGRSGLQLVNMSKGGAAGLQKLRDRAHELGLVMSDEAARATEKFVDSQTDLRASLVGVRNVLGADVMPKLIELTDRLTVLVVKWRPAILAWFRGFAADLPQTLATLRKGVEQLARKLQPLIDAGRWLVDTFGAVNVIATVVTATLVGPLALAIGVATSSVWALGAAILATPIGWILAAIAALVAAGIALWQNWGPITKAFGDAWEWLRTTVGDSIDWILRKLGDLARWAVPDWLEGLIGLDASVDVDAKTSAAPAVTGGLDAAAATAIAAAPGAPGRARIGVDFRNVPRGTRIETIEQRDTDLDLGMGFALEGV